MSTNAPRVLVLGGGLAGLTVARELANNGFSVVLLEKSKLTGGKAGSHFPIDNGNALANVRYEHGYHIFAPWYHNVFRILDEVGIKLKPIARWHYKTVADGWKSLFLPSTPSELMQVLRNSPMPAADTLLYFYFVLDMIGQPLSQKAALDRVTRLGLMRSRWYATENLPKIEEESILKAAAVPLHEMSAYTAKLLSSFFLWTLRPTNLLRMFSAPTEPEPSLFMLPGDLQDTFIDPYTAEVVKAGVDIRYGHEVTKVVLDPATAGSPQRALAHLEVLVDDPQTGARAGEHLHADAFVVATPLDITQQLLGISELIACEPMIGRINHLRTAPMAALHLTLKGPLPKLPREHCFLMGGEYGLSFIDLSEHWTTRPYPLTFIASNFAPLLHLSRQEQYDRLIEEICHFLELKPSDVANWCLFPNVEPGRQLFINTVGSWPNRPDASCEAVSNLFFAGDWVKNGIDLACMEGTVTSAHNAARAVAQRFRDQPGVSMPRPALVPGRYPPLLIRLAVRLLSPLALLVYLWAGGRWPKAWR